MEQFDYQRRERGVMEPVTLAALEEFTQKWLDAGDHVIQHWFGWEREVYNFFRFSPADIVDGSEVMHSVMRVACAICHGSIDEVKRAIRASTPSSLRLAHALLHHIHEVNALLDAEHRYRSGALAADWTMQADGSGRVVVRTESRSKKQEVEH
jgi:hypothetical protein